MKHIPDFHSKLKSLFHRIKAVGLQDDETVMALWEALQVSDDADLTLCTTLEEIVVQQEWRQLMCGSGFREVTPQISGLLHLGMARTYEGLQIPYGLFPQDLLTGVLVVGGINSGKTTLCIQLITEILNKCSLYPGKDGIALQIYDAKLDYAWLLRSYPCVWVLPIEWRKWNPLQVPDGEDVVHHAKMFADVFCTSTTIYDVGRNILITVLIRLYKRFGTPNGSNRFPTIRQLHETLQHEKYTSVREKEACSSLVNRLDGMLTEFGNSLDYSQGYALNELRRHNVVYTLDGLSNYFRNFVITFDLVSTWKYHQYHNLRSDRTRLVYVFDEAHLVFPKELRHKTESLGQIPPLFSVYPLLRETGIGVVLLTQSPRSLDELTVLSNTACKIVKCLYDFEDVADIGASMGLVGEQMKCCTRLLEQEAVGRMAYRWFDPFLFEVPTLRVDKCVNWDQIECFMAPRLQRIPTQGPVSPPVPTAVHPQGPSPADQALIKQLLFDVYNHPFVPVTDRYLRLFGVSGGLGNRVKNLVVQWCYAREVKIHTGGRGGTKLFLELTPDGCRLIAMPLQHRQGIGDFEHQYWQDQLVQEALRRGLQAQKELQIRGKRVDVGILTTPLIALEVATTAANEVSNVQKDFRAGFGRVIVCAISPAVHRQIFNLLPRHVSPIAMQSVEVCMIQKFLTRKIWF